MPTPFGATGSLMSSVGQPQKPLNVKQNAPPPMAKSPFMPSAPNQMTPNAEKAVWARRKRGRGFGR